MEKWKIRCYYCGWMDYPVEVKTQEENAKKRRVELYCSRCGNVMRTRFEGSKNGFYRKVEA